MAMPTFCGQGTLQGPFGYGGSFDYQEAGTGLKLLGHRIYDPGIGRFLTRDPIKDGRNWYAYCDSDPISKSDPAGLHFRKNVGEALLNLWQLPQQIVGAIVSGFAPRSNKPSRPRVWPKDDDTVHAPSPTNFHITFGPVMLHPIGKQLTAHGAAHEKAHQIQSQVLGPMYLPATIGAYFAAIPGGVANFFFNEDDLITSIHDQSLLEKHAEWYADRVAPIN